MDKIELKKLLDTPSGIGLQEFIVENILSLNKLCNVKHCEDAESQALEFRATEKAFNILTNIFYEIIDAKRFEEIKQKKEDILYSL